MQTLIESKVHEIAASLFDGMRQNELDKQNLGLLSGHTGIIIFCRSYLRKYPDEERTEVLEGYMNSFFEQLCGGVDLFTYCTGLAGILDGLRYLNEEKLIEVDCSDIENSYKVYLQQFSLSNIAHRNYDFLHGGIGVVKYFSEDADFVNKALDALEQAAEKDGSKYRWVSRLFEDKFGYNISLSHGMSSIVSVLSEITTPGVDLEKRDTIITNTCNYIMSQEIDHDRYGCYFPSMSLDNEGGEQLHRTRMGWCYGDLGVATTLWQAGRRLQNSCWCDKALEVLLFSAQRRNLPEGSINDAGLCHGAAGVAMMYHYMHLQTGIELFRETRDYWLAAAVKIGCPGEGPAGYRAWRGYDKSGQDEYDLLEGIAGIGQMMLTSLSDDPRDARWMKFLLLNAF